jgi:cytochrome c-type protein NapC
MIFRVWKWSLRNIAIYPVTGFAALFLSGMIFWGGFNWSLELTNTEQFCVSCHEMKTFLYPEYKSSSHFTNRTGVRASCPDCHVPREWVHKVVRKVQATNELFHWLRGTISSREKFEAKRLHLASNVWRGMKETDSRECRNCHGIDSMKHELQSARSRAMHQLAATWDKTCIECHQGIAHKLPRTFDKEVVMDELHDRMEAEKFDCRQCHADMAGPKKGDGWDDEDKD